MRFCLTSQISLYENEMLTRIRSLLISVTLISLCLYGENRVESANAFVGSVQNLSVKALLADEHADSNNAYKFLKLNISWLPPNSSRVPSSYR